MGWKKPLGLLLVIAAAAVDDSADDEDNGNEQCKHNYCNIACLECCKLTRFCYS
jgi:hypothetical protein